MSTTGVQLILEVIIIFWNFLKKFYSLWFKLTIIVLRLTTQIFYKFYKFIRKTTSRICSCKIRSLYYRLCSWIGKVVTHLDLRQFSDFFREFLGGITNLSIVRYFFRWIFKHNFMHIFIKTWIMHRIININYLSLNQ